MRRAFATVSTLLMLTAGAGAQASRTGTIVAANMTAGSVSVVDIATGATLATIPTPDNPHEVAVSSDGKWAVVSIYGGRGAGGNSLMVIDVQRAALARTIDLGASRRPHGMRFLPGDRKLAVTSEATQRVAIVDFASGAVDTLIGTGAPLSHMIAVTPDGKRGYTTNVAPGTISVLDLDARALVNTFAIGTRIEGIAVRPDGREVWVGGNDSQTVYVVNTRTGAIDARIGGFGMPYRIGITPDGRIAVVSDPGDEKIHIVDVAQRARRSSIDVPGASSPQGVTIAPDGLTAFVTLKSAGEVAIVDIAAAKIVRTLAVGGGSDGVGYSSLVAKKP